METSILIADDEPNQLELLDFNLKSAGFSIIKASNGLEALELIENHSPDLIILDWMMPKMSGIDVCRTLRSRSETKQTPIIILSARSEDYTQLSAFDAGADDYISKPVKPKILLKKIESIFKRINKKNEEINVIDLGEIKIDRNSYLVYIKNQEISLPRKEFELFYLLASKPGKVFTRDEIMGKVWGSEVVVGDRTIDVHIRKLREKIGDLYFKTVKGIGYKFNQ